MDTKDTQPMEQTQAAAQPAEVDVFGGQQPTMAEYESFRQTGDLPARFKPAEPADTAPAAASEGHEPGSEGGSDTPAEAQEPAPRKPRTAPQRIAQINAAIEKLWQEEEPDVVRIAQLNATVDKIERQSGLKRQAEPAPASPAPASTEPAHEAGRPKPTVDAVDKDGKPKYATYEEYVEDLADWKAEGQVVKFQQAQQQQAAQAKFIQKVEEAKAIYGDEFERSDEAAGIILNDKALPPIVRARLARSEYLPHLMFTMSGDADGVSSFLKSAKADPFGALDYIALTERGIADELAKGKVTAPEKKQTTAPKPPSPVGGGSSRAFDVNDESLSTDEWHRKRNKQVGAG